MLTIMFVLSIVFLNFRYHLNDQEQEIESLEIKLEKILKLATQSCDSGREFIRNQS